MVQNAPVFNDSATTTESTSRGPRCASKNKKDLQKSILPLVKIENAIIVRAVPLHSNRGRVMVDHLLGKRVKVLMTS
jgi:hypothetical protein